MNRINKLLITGLAGLMLIVTAYSFFQIAPAAYGGNPGQSILTDEQLAAEQAQHARTLRTLAGGKNHKSMKVLMEVASIQDPNLQELAAADLPGSTPVIGISVEGQSCAFDLTTMRSIEHHVVNLTLQDHPLAVTYCDLSDCVRVLGDTSGTPLAVSVTGLDIADEMVIHLNGEHYGQRSEAIPVEDYPFERTSLEDWQNRYPNTMIYTKKRSRNRDID